MTDMDFFKLSKGVPNFLHNVRDRPRGFHFTSNASYDVIGITLQLESLHTHIPGQSGGKEGSTGFHEVVGLDAQWVTQSSNSHPVAISDYASTASRARVALGHAIKIDFVPSIRRERQFDLLSFSFLVFIPILSISLI